MLHAAPVLLRWCVWCNRSFTLLQLLVLFCSANVNSLVLQHPLSASLAALLCGRWPYCSNMSGVMGELHSPPSNIHTTSNDIFYLREQRPVVSCWLASHNFLPFTFECKGTRWLTCIVICVWSGLNSSIIRMYSMETNIAVDIAAGVSCACHIYMPLHMHPLVHTHMHTHTTLITCTTESSLSVVTTTCSV